MTDVQFEARREREEARIMSVMRDTARNNGIEILSDFTPSEDPLDTRTHAKLRYQYALSPRLVRNVAVFFAVLAIVIAAIVHALWPLSMAALISFFASLILTAAAVSRCRWTPLTPRELEDRIDIALNEAGFHVEQTDDGRVISCRFEEGEEE